MEKTMLPPSGRYNYEKLWHFYTDDLITKILQRLPETIVFHPQLITLPVVLRKPDEKYQAEMVF
jgi:hypothetical protein